MPTFYSHILATSLEIVYQLSMLQLPTRKTSPNSVCSSWILGQKLTALLVPGNIPHCFRGIQTQEKVHFHIQNTINDLT